MTKVSDLEFKTRMITNDEEDDFGIEGLSKVSTAVIDKGFPFMIAVMYLPKEFEDNSPYDIMFFDKHSDLPIPVKEIIASDILNEIKCKQVSDTSILRLDEDTVNSIIEVAENFGVQVKQYIDTVSKFRDRIVLIPTTMQ